MGQNPLLKPRKSSKTSCPVSLQSSTLANRLKFELLTKRGSRLGILVCNYLNSQKALDLKSPYQLRRNQVKIYVQDLS